MGHDVHLLYLWPKSSKMKKILIMAAGVFFLTSCGGEKSSSSESSDNKMEESKSDMKACKYTINEEEVDVKWTAFKFTDKTGVGGTFNDLSVSGKVVESPEQILNDVKFTIPTDSINSNNTDRDMKIRSFFFGKLENKGEISGKIHGVDGNEREGSVSVSISLNGQSRDAQMKYFVEGDRVTINGGIDVSVWDAMVGIEALNTVCKDLHTGEDGVSKLWPNVDIEVVALLNKECK